MTITNNCLNPKCKKIYPVVDMKEDDGFCCFECWESINCDEEVETEEEISIE